LRKDQLGDSIVSEKRCGCCLTISLTAVSSTALFKICFCILVLTLLNFFNQMDKVHSTIKSLECVDILQVNVKEDTDIVHSGHGSGTVRLLVM